MKELLTIIINFFETLFSSREHDIVFPDKPTTTTSIEKEPAIPAQQINKEPMKKPVIVCIDNGHGKDTPGKRSPWSAHGVKPELPFFEYQYCREIAKRLEQVLIEDGYDVYMVTPEENDVKLEVRGARINKVIEEASKVGKHVLSISLHNDAAGNGSKWYKAYGWSVWTTPGQTNSDVLATCLFNAADEVLSPLGKKLRKDMKDGDPDYENNWAICKIPKCPAVLTENMFQDCVEEVEFLISEAGKDAIVKIHRRGIAKFVEKMGW